MRHSFRKRTPLKIPKVKKGDGLSLTTKALTENSCDHAPSHLGRKEAERTRKKKKKKKKSKTPSLTILDGERGRPAWTLKLV